MTETYDSYLVAYKALPQPIQTALRTVARDQMIEEGCPEIGSSDISARVYELYRHHGSFVAVLEAVINEMEMFGTLG